MNPPAATDPPTALLGWDVGGAHLKAALIGADGELARIEQIVSPLWMGLNHLHSACQELLDRLPRVRFRHVVTMTGEMADFFPDRATGVAQIIAFLEALLVTQRRESLLLYAGASGLLEPEAACRLPDAVASANWMATAQACALPCPDALLVDIGSTTTDLIGLQGGRVAALGSSDASRLDHGELAYLGIVRTPLLALADRAPVLGSWRPTIREYYATTSDVFRVLGELDESVDLQATADNGPKSFEGSARRLLRQIGEDLSPRTQGVAVDLARWYRERFLQEIVIALHQRLSRADLTPGAPVIAAGIGASYLAEIARRIDRKVLAIEDLLAPAASPELRRMASHCAPALALARLGWMA